MPNSATERGSRPAAAVVVYRALAWAVLLAGATLLALAVVCAAALLYGWWDAARTPAVPVPRDGTGAGVAFLAWVVGLLSFGIGAGAWWAGRRLPGTPARLRPRAE